MNERLKAYIDKCGRAPVDEAKLDDLRKQMEQAVPEIAASIKQREEFAAELRLSASRTTEADRKKPG